ncbi:GNAT family N-acetyltransferase [Amaricoccus solimangrovi]|uniref:N-acetyltransferase n=1 Tax=Amaricoccus solimangrovi TaxID=2589815 RepID=A0A501WHK9_9RHOB|nr:N-acetyltransferase [Amaricoccus solimangrovi]TPE49373.1 N-acetyltransferase [Amaricoccus solimangrovi]
MSALIRPERPADAGPIRAVTKAAFATAPHAAGTEAEIIEGLRVAGALALSLVAEEGGEVIGHVAFSPVTIGGAAGWFGLGPVSVRPDRQRAGIGRALIGAGLARLRAWGAAGCVLVGDPDYYRRFGFASDPGVSYPGVPGEYVLRLVLAGPPARGAAVFHPAFGAGGGGLKSALRRGPRADGGRHPSIASSSSIIEAMRPRPLSQNFGSLASRPKGARSSL